MKTISLYVCEICNAEYQDRGAALDCEAQGVPKPTVSVGDIVFNNAGYGWFDGDARWVTNPQIKGKPRNPDHGNCFSDCCTMRFYYVVTAIDTDYKPGSHRLRYHLCTKAMNGAQGHRQFYVYQIGEKVSDAPAFLYEDSEDLIGQKAKYRY